MTSKNMTPEQRERSNALQRERRKANPERTKAHARKGYVKNEEKNRAYARKNWAEKKEEIKVKYKETNLKSGANWRAKNPERERSRCQAWKNANKDRRAVTNALWRANNPERIRAYAHNRRARDRQAEGALSPDLAERLFVLQKGKCACCGKNLSGDYEMDHIVPLSKGGANVDSNIQLLTFFCNRSKGAKDPINYMQLKGMLL